MPRFVLLVMAAVIFGGWGTPAVAGLTLNLSSPTDLTRLTVGQQFTLNVTVAGLPVGSDFVFVMDTRILFPSADFAPVANSSYTSGLTPGSIFFDPSQITNLNALSSLTSGVATGNFSDSSPFSSFAINQNGLFYSFNLRATTVGNGTIGFDPAADTNGINVGNRYAANDTSFAFGILCP